MVGALHERLQRRNSLNVAMELTTPVPAAGDPISSRLDVAGLRRRQEALIGPARPKRCRLERLVVGLVDIDHGAIGDVRLVRLPGRHLKLAQRDALDAVNREQAFRGHHEQLTGRFAGGVVASARRVLRLCSHG